MKKIILGVFTLVFVICATACSSSNSSSKTTSSSSNLVEETTETVDTMEVKDGPLTKIGQWTVDDNFGKIELLKITSNPQSLTLTDGLVVTINDMKLFNASNMNESATTVLGTNKKSGNYIQITASVKNDTDNEYKSIFPETIILSDGTQIKHSLVLTSSTDVKPRAKNDELLFFYFLDEKTTDSVKLYFDSVADERGWSFGDIKGEITILF